jgi:PadR family transcriptional regulator PadR
MSEQTIDLPQGTLDLLILRTLVPEPMHGWAISERIHQVSSRVLQVLTKSGRKQLEVEEGEWKKLAAAVAQVLETT